MHTWERHEYGGHHGSRVHLCQHDLHGHRVPRSYPDHGHLRCGLHGDLDGVHRRWACRGCSLSRLHGRGKLGSMSARRATYNQHLMAVHNAIPICTKRLAYLHHCQRETHVRGHVLRVHHAHLQRLLHEAHPVPKQVHHACHVVQLAYRLLLEGELAPCPSPGRYRYLWSKISCSVKGGCEAGRTKELVKVLQSPNVSVW